MENKENLQILDLMASPAFAVSGSCVSRVNQAAARMLIREGMPVSTLLLTGAEELEAFTEGSLYVTVSVSGEPWGASVTMLEEEKLFVLDQQIQSDALRALALAARELRAPLGEAMIAANRLAEAEDAGVRQTAGRINRRLYQLLRIISNMSDAADSSPLHHREKRNMDALFREIFARAAQLAESVGIQLQYEGLSEEVESIADAQQLERAALNLISNAIKFSPAGSTISVRLKRCGNMLQLRVADSGSGIPEALMGTVFRRYLREPSIEESRQGIGLGILLIRSAAADHGGAVLIDQPEGTGTRVTMTLAIRKDEEDAMLRSHRLAVDYAGEYDHALLELADCLPAEQYLDI